ncbi:MAG: acetoacetate--CoA ligase [Acidimicrobiales bacterium]|nr:acetoacetate--CoA ligase [Acidimicrobiales bacterium]
MSADAPLWTPSRPRVEAARLSWFRGRVAARTGAELADSVALHRLSVERPDEFWGAVWDELGVIGERGDVAAAPGDGSLPGASWFPGARVNLAENLLRGADGRPGVRFAREDGVRRALTRAELAGEAAALAAALRAEGVGPGDRVAAWMPNTPETLVTMLAATSIGAVFSSTSPDFGTAGVLDRFGQIEPAVLVAADGYVYAGRRHDCLARLRDIAAGLPSARRVVVVGELDPAPTLQGVQGAVAWEAFVAPHRGARPRYERLPFDHPGFILYSSGTTGAPKCIVHRAAGLLVKHLTEHQLHCDIGPGDRAFYFTTCGWMMWNWLMSGLASEAELLLYDGSPFHPHPAILWDLADECDLTFFGTSAKFLDASRKAGVAPRESHRLASLRTIASTGSPLVPEGFAYVYDRVKADVHLASISGGTDLCGCFVAGDPTRPVFAGEIQGPGLGMAVDVWDVEGRPVTGTAGELVCTRPFPTTPLGFWGDDDGSRYRAAYFERFPGVWAHGDFASWTEHGGMVIHGRSDATLNAGGVRIGTAELYRAVESMDEVVEALAIGQPWDDDTRIVLFVVAAPGVELDDGLRERIRARIRDRCSPRHVPSRVVAVAELPRTRSGKLVELAVADVVAGRPVRNREALANPDALDAFRDVPELAT